MPRMSRRTLLRSMAVGGAAVSAPGLLTACSSGSGDGDVSNAGKKLAPWPAYRPAAGPKPDLAPTGEGVQAGYTSYPSDLVKSVSAALSDVISSPAYLQVLKNYGLESSAITDARVNFAQ